MRIIAIFLSILAFYALLQLVNIELFHFMPVFVSGSEGGLIAGAFAAMLGPLIATIALLLSAYPFRQFRNDRNAQILFAWCCLLLLGFIAIFLKVGLSQTHAL